MAFIFELFSSADFLLMKHLAEACSIKIGRFIEAGRHYLFFAKKSINFASAIKLILSPSTLKVTDLTFEPYF